MTDKRVLFIDRDGTLIEEPEDHQVDAVEKVRLMPGVIPSLLALQGAGFRFVMVSNQDGLGTESFPQADFDAPHAHVLELFASQGISFDEIFVCPHTDADGCDCRKPRTGLLTRYLASTNLDLVQSAVIGDRDTDLQLAEAIGVRGLKVSQEAGTADTWERVTSDLLAGARRATVTRKTNETNIRVVVDLNQSGETSVSTGLGFFDHMLEQIARHGGFNLELTCEGDLEVDEHHTIEDVAISLGGALREALGEKLGIGRYGFFLPMDETDAQVSLDLSGRSDFRFDGEFERDKVGGLPTEMVGHFFRSLSESLGAALHISVNGENEHHKVEACFKAVGRALRQAFRQEGSELPTTKGALA